MPSAAWLRPWHIKLDKKQVRHTWGDSRFVWQGLWSLFGYTDFEKEMDLKGEHVGLITAEWWVSFGPFWAELWHNKGKKKIKEAALSLLEYESMFFVKQVWWIDHFSTERGRICEQRSRICQNPHTGLDWQTGCKEVGSDPSNQESFISVAIVLPMKGGWQPWHKIQFIPTQSGLIMLMQTEWWLGWDRGIIPEEDQSRLP